MVFYVIEGYDEDNDMFTQLKVVRNYKQAVEICRTLSELCKNDMIVNRYNGRCEPFDYIRIRKIGHYIDDILMVNDELTDEGHAEFNVEEVK